LALHLSDPGLQYVFGNHDLDVHSVTRPEQIDCGDGGVARIGSNDTWSGTITAPGRRTSASCAITIAATDGGGRRLAHGHCSAGTDATCTGGTLPRAVPRIRGPAGSVTSVAPTNFAANVAVGGPGVAARLLNGDGWRQLRGDAFVFAAPLANGGNWPRWRTTIVNFSGNIPSQPYWRRPSPRVCGGTRKRGSACVIGGSACGGDLGLCSAAMPKPPPHAGSIVIMVQAQSASRPFEQVGNGGNAGGRERGYLCGAVARRRAGRRGRADTAGNERSSLCGISPMSSGAQSGRRRRQRLGASAFCFPAAANGSTAGMGGAAIVNANGAITTTAISARHSGAAIGGGGAQHASVAGAVALGGNGAGGGGGGTVTAQFGSVTTFGLGSNAIEAHSIGGGGGTAPIPASLCRGRQRIGHDDVGAVTVSMQGFCKPPIRVQPAFSRIDRRRLRYGGTSGAFFAFGGSGGARDAGSGHGPIAGVLVNGLGVGTSASPGVSRNRSAAAAATAAARFGGSGFAVAFGAAAALRAMARIVSACGQLQPRCRAPTPPPLTATILATSHIGRRRRRQRRFAVAASPSRVHVATRRRR